MVLGTIKVKALYFLIQSPFSKTFIVGADELSESDFMTKYCSGSERAERACGIKFDDEFGTKFFMVFVSDCFDPPIAIVRAENENDAIEYFVQNKNWTHVPPDEINENDDNISWSDNGIAYRNDNINVHEVKLTIVEVN